MNSANALDAMQAIKQVYGDSAVVGMGRCSTWTWHGAHSMRVRISSSRRRSTGQSAISSTRQALMIPGAITLTEAVDAWATGAKLIKIFPIGNLGVDYFKSIRGPLDHIKFMCNGGMNEINAAEFLKAGAVACGMANWLTGDGHMALDVIARRARVLRDNVDAVRSGQRDRTSV